MSEYEMQVLIDELQKLVVIKAREVFNKEIEIENLKATIERLEVKCKHLTKQLTPTTCDKEENKN